MAQQAAGAAAPGEWSGVPSMFGAQAERFQIWPLRGGGRAAETPSGPDALAAGEAEAPGNARPKSAGRAFVLSAVLPGSGEWYAGSRLKGAVFFGVEAAAVGLWYAWTGKGNDLEDEFRAYADEHWDPLAYLNWRETSRAIRYNSFTHALPCSAEVRAGNFAACGCKQKQQYYELLGKYDQFVAGWDDLVHAATGNPVANLADFDSVETVASARRLDYEDRRDDSNRYLKRAGNVASLILVNHVLSAIDAARTARAAARGVPMAVIERRTRLVAELRPGTRGALPVLRAYRPFD